MRFETLGTVTVSSVLACGGHAMAQFIEDVDVLVTAESDELGDFFGWFVTPLSDANGDGVTDFAVARTFKNSFKGAVTVYSGVDGSEIWTYNETITSAITGFSLAVIDDVNGDGVDEVVAGSPFAHLDATQVFVFSGADGQIIHIFEDPTATNAYGYALATQADFNGDGVEDLAFNANSAGWPTQNIGEVFIYSADDFSLVLSIFPPPAQMYRFGTSLAFLGDVDGEPGDELAIASRYDQNGQQGRIQVFSYVEGEATILYTIDDVNLGSPISGNRIDGGKDYNGDGVGDLFLGERVLDRVRIFSGADGSEIMTVSGPADSLFGSGRMIDDVDGDDQADLIIGAYNESSGGEEAGQAAVYSGADGSLIRSFTATEDRFHLGVDAVAFGDLNLDGALDFLIPGFGSEDDVLFGAAFIVAGEPAEVVGDTNGDGVVGTIDLLLLLASWGPCDECIGCAADFDGDCSVNKADMMLLLANWG